MMVSRSFSYTWLFALFLFFSHAVSAQLQNLPPNLRREPRNADEAAYRQIQRQRVLESQQRAAMREAEYNARSTATLPRERQQNVTEADLKRIRSLLEPNAADKERYKDLLQQPRTGIFRLFPNSDCESSAVIEVGGVCANHVPGGSSYSFRPGAILPDIHFNNGRLVAEGYFAQMVMTTLGDLPIERIGLMSDGMDFLTEYSPALDYNAAKDQKANLNRGISHRGRTYSSAAAPVLNAAYALRIIPYRNGNNLLRRQRDRAVDKDDPLAAFMLMRDDHRIDVIVAFKIIRIESDGNLTIVWKELARSKSPKITFDEGTPLMNF